MDLKIHIRFVKDPESKIYPAKLWLSEVWIGGSEIGYGRNRRYSYRARGNVKFAVDFNERCLGDWRKAVTLCKRVAPRVKCMKDWRDGGFKYEIVLVTPDGGKLVYDETNPMLMMALEATE